MLYICFKNFFLKTQITFFIYLFLCFPSNHSLHLHSCSLKTLKPADIFKIIHYWIKWFPGFWHKENSNCCRKPAPDFKTEPCSVCPPGLKKCVIWMLFGSPPPAAVELQAEPDHRLQVWVCGRGGLQEHHLWGRSLKTKAINAQRAG